MSRKSLATWNAPRSVVESALMSYRQKVSPREAYPSMLTLPLPMRSVPPVASVSRMSLA